MPLNMLVIMTGQNGTVESLDILSHHEIIYELSELRLWPIIYGSKLEATIKFIPYGSINLMGLRPIIYGSILNVPTWNRLCPSNSGERVI